jgi:hypothetical protein
MNDTASRPKDEPNISPLEFLFAVMHDPTCDLQHRMNAAVKLLELGMGGYSRVPEVHIKIEKASAPDFQWHRRVYKSVGHDPYEWEIKGNA